MGNPSTTPLSLSLFPRGDGMHHRSVVYPADSLHAGSKVFAPGQGTRPTPKAFGVGRVPSRGGSFVVVGSRRAVRSVTGRRHHDGAVSPRQICRRAAFSL